MDYSKFYKTFAPFFKKLYRLEVVGVENIPDGGVIIAPNHTAFSDGIVVSAAAGGRQIRFMAKKELFHTPIAPLLKAFGAYPVDRGNADVTSIKKTLSIVEAGEAVGIFPQGTRRGGVDPRTTEPRSGIGMIAFRSKAPVVPVMIENKRMKTGIFRKNRVTFGKPIYFEELGFENGGREEYLNAANIIFSRICDLRSSAALPAAEENPAIAASAEAENDK